MARLLIANKERTLGQLDVAIKRFESTRVAVYQEAVGKVFRRILRQTPQFTGAAVAHWTIGLDAPSTFSDPSLGQKGIRAARSASGEQRPQQRGSPYWISVAWKRESPKLKRIRKDTRVFITNGVIGDSGEMYLEMLQDPSYAAQKLRDVNKPLETVYDSVAYVMGQYWGKRIDPFEVYVPSYGANE